MFRLERSKAIFLRINLKKGRQFDMATKRAKRAKRTEKTDASKSAEKRRMAKTALRLSEKARGEVARLLKEQRAGSITGEQLELGLEEVIENLQRMLNHILASL
jgi:hypothetical protein